MKGSLVLLTVAALAAALAVPATAKEMSVALASGAPPSVGVGERWTAELLVHGEPNILAEAAPGILLRGPGGEERTFTARPTGKRAPDGQLLYRAVVAFPAEGSWRYQLLDGVTDRAYEGGVVRVGADAGAPASPVPAAATERETFPLLPLLAGVLLAALAAGTAIVVFVRRSRVAAR